MLDHVGGRCHSETHRSQHMQRLISASRPADIANPAKHNTNSIVLSENSMCVWPDWMSIMFTHDDGNDGSDELLCVLGCKWIRWLADG